MRLVLGFVVAFLLAVLVVARVAGSITSPMLTLIVAVFAVAAIALLVVRRRA